MCHQHRENKKRTTFSILRSPSLQRINIVLSCKTGWLPMSTYCIFLTYCRPNSIVVCHGSSWAAYGVMEGQKFTWWMYTDYQKLLVSRKSNLYILVLGFHRFIELLHHVPWTDWTATSDIETPRNSLLFAQKDAASLTKVLSIMMDGALAPPLRDFGCINQDITLWIIKGNPSLQPGMGGFPTGRGGPQNNDQMILK